MLNRALKHGKTEGTEDHHRHETGGIVAVRVDGKTEGTARGSQGDLRSTGIKLSLVRRDESAIRQLSRERH